MERCGSSKSGRFYFTRPNRIRFKWQTRRNHSSPALPASVAANSHTSGRGSLPSKALHDNRKGSGLVRHCAQGADRPNRGNGPHRACPGEKFALGATKRDRLRIDRGRAWVDAVGLGTKRHRPGRSDVGEDHGNGWTHESHRAVEKVHRAPVAQQNHRDDPDDPTKGP